MRGTLWSRKAMNKPENFEVMRDYAVFRPTGEISLERAMQLTAAAVAHAREQKIKKLMVDMTGLSGVRPPNISERYFYIREWAGAAQGQVSIAMVAEPTWIDYERIGATFAKNAGLCGMSFLSEEEALAWLQNVK